MSWDDDSWKDGYDTWKLASPYDEYDEPCDHEDYEIDILTGCCHCDRCSESWHATPEQIQMQIDHEAAYYEAMESEERRQWWRDLWSRVRSFFWRSRTKTWASDDDIPF